MTELKTLKELILPYTDMDGSMGWISPQDLRQEAMNWVKHYTKKNEEKCERCDEEQTLPVLDDEFKIDWIKDFFDITDEEIK